MTNQKALSLGQIKSFLRLDKFQFKAQTSAERNTWIEKVLKQFRYKYCSKKDKGALRSYIVKMTGISQSQLTRLILKYDNGITLKPQDYQRNSFSVTYTKGDIELLAKVDNAHNRLSGPATIKIMRDDYSLSAKTEFVRLKDISVGHIYRLRGEDRYQHNTLTFTKTEPVINNIGERRKPEPNGKPGYLCVDTVHQGDKMDINGKLVQKGVYHINIVDMVTQFEFVGATETISEHFLKPILEELLEKFPFIIIELHADNGKEYINKIVLKLLKKLFIELTKSRPRKSNDNALVETKNGSVIRKHMGKMHIPQENADKINEFYSNHFNDYLNYHRPCGFPKIKVEKNGKERKTYPKENYMTPYEKFKSLKNAEQYLKPGITFEQLDNIAYAKSHTDYAEEMQKEKRKLFKNLSFKINHKSLS